MYAKIDRDNLVARLDGGDDAARCAWLRAVAAVGALTAASVFADEAKSTLDIKGENLVYLSS